VLRDPLSRVEYLIAIEEGRDSGEGAAVKPQPPMDLLEEMLEIQEALEEAKTSGLDAATSARLGQEQERLRARQSAGDAALVARFADWDRLIDTGGDRTPLLAFFKQALAARAYLRTVIDDLGEALGQDQDTHVSHRRH
jgi:HSCB C-terminal oligomerisation domain